MLCSSQNLIFTKAARKSSFLRAAPHASFKTPGAHLHSKGAALPLYGARAILNFMWIEDDKHIPAAVKFGVDVLSLHKNRAHDGRRGGLCVTRLRFFTNVPIIPTELKLIIHWAKKPFQEKLFEIKELSTNPTREVGSFLYIHTQNYFKEDFET